MQRRQRFAERYTWIWAAATIVFRMILNARGLLNYAPVGTVSLFAGARMSLLRALCVPIAMMIATDTLLYVTSGFNTIYSPFHWSRPVVYASFVMYTLLGRSIVGDSNSIVRIGLAGLLGEAQFFLLTNGASWLADPDYDRTFAGLMACYAKGIPFINWPAPLFLLAIFGVYALVPKPRAEAAPVPADLEAIRSH
jgi:hypothetical protein